MLLSFTGRRLCADEEVAPGEVTYGDESRLKARANVSGLHFSKPRIGPVVGGDQGMRVLEEMNEPDFENENCSHGSV